MAALGDILASAATGKDPDYADIEAGAALKGATFQDTMAQVPLRGAQTKEALANADKARLEAIALQRKQEEIDKLGQNLADGGVPNAQTLGHLVAAGQPINGATEAMGHVQDQGLVSTLSNPSADQNTRLAAASGLKHEVLSPYTKLDPDYVDVRNVAPAGAPAPDQLSQMGQSMVGNKAADTNLKNAKAGQIGSTDDSVDPNEMAYHAHVFNTTGAVPSFGMGQSKLRQYFLKAAYMDAAGIPITAQSLGIAPEHVKAVGAPPAAAPAAGAVAPAAGAAPTPAPLSPQDAANNTADARINTKATQAEVSNAQKMVGVVQAQSYKAEKSYGRALDLADQLAKTRGPDGSPLINQAFLDWGNHVTGNPLTSAFVHEITVAHDEYAKIISGAMGAAGITDKGREAADKLFGEHMNLDTLKGIGVLMGKDMNDARMGYVKTIQGAHSAMQNPGTNELTHPNAPTTAATIPPAAAASLKSGKVTKFGNGQSWTLGPDGQPLQVH